MKKNPCIDCLVRPCCEEICPKANDFIQKAKKLSNLITTVLFCTSVLIIHIVIQILIYDKADNFLMFISVCMFLVGSQTALFGSINKVKMFVMSILLKR